MYSVYRGDVQGLERIITVLTVLRGEILDRDRRDTRVNVQRVSGIHALTRRKLDVDQLYLQQGVHRAGWCRMYGMYRGDIQGRERIVTVLTVLSGEVLGRDGRDTRVDVQRVPHAHVLTWRKLDADQLHLQQGIHGS